MKAGTISTHEPESISGISEFDLPTLESDISIAGMPELLKEIKNLNENITGLKEVVASLSGLLNSLTEEQRNLSEKQELMEINNVYEKYGKPLEKKHKGKFACITPNGDFVVGEDSIDAFKKAEKEELEDCILFQIGNPGGGIDM